MANPYDVAYVVKDGEGPLTYNCKKYQDGETIMVHHTDICCFVDDVLCPGFNDTCFPEYKLGPDGYPTAGYRVPFLVPAGATDAIHAVPSIEGCAPAGMVCFHYCSPCLYVGYDAAPITDPADPNGQAGGGADPNPTCRDLVNGSDCVETIHIANPGDADVLVILSYYR